MIIPMKKVTLLCLEQDKNAVLEKLRSLGVMQIKYAKTPESDDVTALTKQSSEAEYAARLLLTEEGEAVKADAVPGADAVAKVLALNEERIALGKQKESLEHDREALAPWGEFDPASLDMLKANGLFPYLCIARKTDYDDFVRKLPDGTAVSVITEDKISVYYLAVTRTEIPGGPDNAAVLPKTTLSAIESDLKSLKDRQDAIRKEMLALKSSMDAIRIYTAGVQQKLEFSSVRDGMAESGKVAYVFGYVPVTGVDDLQNAAKTSGMALLIEDPDADDDQVPTYIVKPKFLNIMDPLFDFIGVTPGYRENDVNVFFLIFFPIFFALIVGDAGYGMLFLVISLFFKYKLKNNEKAKLPLNLVIMLSVCTIIWGWMNGSWFGIPVELLPCFMAGLPFFTNPAGSDAAIAFANAVGLEDMGNFKSSFMQFLCFAIAGIHLPAARLFRFFDDVRGTWRAWGHLGWAMLLAANAILATNLIVYTRLLTIHPALATTMYVLFGVGVVLVTVTISGSAALNLPFSLIGSFVDILSYIRLFAVALAGSLISLKFNEMGVQLMHSLPDALAVIGWILMLFVAVFGNVLNIALNLLSVLVHAIRLNTLEFSNHIEMQWAGFRFHPFKKDNQ